MIRKGTYLRDNVLWHDYILSEMRQHAYLLYILGPFWGITEGHESTVGQDGEHDQYAENRRDKVKEHLCC